MPTVSSTSTGVDSDNLRSELAYSEMTMGVNGSVMNIEEKALLRERFGYCKECQGLPALLYNVKKSRMNPLWVTKEARAVAGECAQGVCFICHPGKDPSRKYRRRKQGDIGSLPSPKPLISDPRTTPPPPPRNTSAPGNLKNLETSFPPNHKGAIAAETKPICPPNNHSRHGVVTPLPGIPWSPIDSSPRKNETQRHKKTFQGGIFVPDFQSSTADEAGSGEADLSNAQSESQSSFDSNPVDPDGDSQNDINSHPPGKTELQVPPATSSEENGSTAQPLVPDSNLSQEEIKSITDGVDSFVKEMIATGNGEFLADIVLGAMREHSKVAEIQTHCLRVIWDICKDDDDDNNKNAIMMAGAPADILNALKLFPDNVSLQEKGCGAIWSLAVNTNNRVILIRRKACAQIVKALQTFIATQSLVRAAIGTMRTLSPDAEAREHFKNTGASKSTAEAMVVHRSCVSVQRDGCAFLTNCAVNIEKQYVTVLPREEMDAVVQAMAHHRQEVSVMQGACFALKNFTHEEKNCRTLRQCKGVYDLLGHASTFQESLQCCADATDILERLQLSQSMDESMEDQAYVSLLHIVDSQAMTSQAPRSVLDFMRNYDWSPRLIGVSLQMFRRLVSEQKSHRNNIFETGVLRDIVRYCSNFDSDAFVCEEACAFISLLAQQERDHPAIIETGCCSVIFNSLENNADNEKVVNCALEALKLMSANIYCFEQLREKMHLVTNAYEAHPASEAVQLHAMTVISSLDYFDSAR